MSQTAHIIIEDGMMLLGKRLEKLIRYLTNTDSAYDRFCLISDDNAFRAYEHSILKTSHEKGLIKEFSSYSIGGEAESFSDISGFSATANTAYLFFADLRTDSVDALKALENVISALKNDNKSTLIASFIIPELPAIPGGVTRLAEREFNYFVENDPQQKERYKAYIEAESLCRKAVNSGSENIKILRFDNLFGPSVHGKFDFDVNAIMKEICASKTIKISADDYKVTHSCTYIRDALYMPFFALAKGRLGHVYNCSSIFTTVAEIKLTLQTRMNGVFATEANIPAVPPADESRALGFLKFLKLGYKSDVTDGEAYTRTACAFGDIPYDISPNLKVYDGKLQRLKDVEVDLLKEVDRICRENDIQYFIAGGSLLGAIRNGKSIPWDDDLDIGMLREDFEKFRKVCPGALNEKYIYSSPFEESSKGVHYYLDKIRLNNSYFSTQYSNHFLFEDGVFLDVIVYDQTSDNRFLEKMQIFSLKAWVRLINIRWYNRPRKKVYYRFSKLALPFMRLVPFKWYHKMFDRAAMRYSKKKNAEYVIDGLGQHITLGRFPRSYISTVEYHEFDGFMAPIPTGYDGYLSFFYGPNYKENPPLSYRLATHNFSRLDLGEYVFDDHADQKFRGVDINGELYEKE